MKRNLIIFDCFGVIFDEIAPVFFRKYLPCEQAALIKDKIFIPADLGKITYEQIFDNIAAELNMDRKEVCAVWDSLIHLRKEMISVIEKLSETADIALLSNAGLGFVESLFEKYDLNRLFDKIFISCNLGMAKPDPEIYKYCVKQFNKDYDNIYMIDDNIGNIEHLPEIGIIPVHFTDIRSLKNKFNITN